MSSFIGIDTAIGWAHWKVRGGWKNALLTAGGFAGVIVMIILMTIRMDPRDSMNILTGWRLALLLLEGGLLVLLAGTRVAAAVRSDITSRMIESHRLMPVSPWVAITGYFWGPTGQSVLMGAATFLIGLVVVMAAGIGPAMWIGPSIVLATFSVFFWVVMAYLASILRAPAGVITTAVFLVLVMRGAPLDLFPGLIPLLTPFIENTIFQLRTAAGEVHWQMLAGWTAQAWIAGALYIGAARKYRRGEDSALAILPGMMLLAGWVGVSALGMARWEDFVPQWYWHESGRFEAGLMGSIWSAMLLALVPVSNAAQMRGWALRMPLVALGCVAVIWPLGLVWTDRVLNESRALITTGVVAASFLLTAGYILKIAYRFSPRAWVPLLIWLILFSTGPIITDSILWGFSSVETDFSLTSIAAISPGGALGMAWLDSDARVAPGLIAQCACAVIWAAIFHLTEGRKAKSIPGGEMVNDQTDQSMTKPE